MDFRGTNTLATGRESNTTKSALLVNGALNALFSLIISVSLIAGGVSAFFFSVVVLGYAMVILAMSILIEFGLVVISPDDFLILAHRPVSSRTFFAVKFSNLCFYILIQGAFLSKGELTDPFTGRTSGFATMFPIMSFFLAGTTTATLLPFCDEYQGGWIFHVAPVAQRERILKAVKKAIVLVLFVPLFLLVVAAFSVFWPVSHALAFGLCGFVLGLLAFQVMLFRFRDFPFTRKFEKGKQTIQVTVFLIIFGMFSVMSVLLHLFASGWVWVLSVLGVPLALSMVLGHFNNRAYAASKSFQDE